MTRLTGLFLRGSKYYMRVVLPLDHPLRAIRQSGKIVLSLNTSEYRSALVEGLNKRAQILTGDYLALNSMLTPSKRIERPTEPHQSLRDLHIQWVESHSASKDSDQACLRAVKLFEKHIGYFPLSQISRKMGDEFRVWLLKQSTSSKTARDRLVWIKGLLNYASIELELIPRNPWRGIEIKARTESPRQPWNEEWLTRLLNHSIWNGGYLPKKRKAGGPAGYWLPLIALYTGARCSELCQLNTKDITQSNGIWIISISDSELEQNLKSQSSKRKVPIHRELIRLGILEYLQTIQEGSVWPELPKRTGKSGGYFSQYFSEFRTEIGAPKNMDFHSFRHLARTNLLNGGVSETIIDTLLGHSISGSIGAKVYTHTTNQILNEAINKLPIYTQKINQEISVVSQR